MFTTEIANISQKYLTRVKNLQRTIINKRWRNRKKENCLGQIHLEKVYSFLKRHLSGNFKGDRKDKWKLILRGEGILALGNGGTVA